MAVKSKKEPGGKKPAHRSHTPARTNGRKPGPKKSHSKRRRKHGLLSAGNNTNALAMQFVEAAVGGAFGAVIYNLVPISNPMFKAAVVGGGGVLVATKMKRPLAGAGMIAVGGVKLGAAFKVPYLNDEPMEANFYDLSETQAAPMFIDQNGFRVYPINDGTGRMALEDGNLSENTESDFIYVYPNI